MLNTPQTPPETGTTPDGLSDRGSRTFNADAMASVTDPGSGHMAFVVADGIGDHLLAARAARLAAATTAHEGVTHGAVGGLQRAQEALRSQFHEPDADCVLVVAVLPAEPHAHEMCEIAWVGDCRAYRWSGEVLHQITVDLTAAEYLRAHGTTPPARMEHVVTASVRTAREDEIGSARVGAGPGRLLLCSDGVHKRLDIAQIKTLLAAGMQAHETAAALIDAARHHGSTDNATAMVVDRPMT